MTRMTHRRRGVSLAEVVIAVGLVAVVGIPILGMLAATDHEAMTSEDYMQAEALAQRRMADVLATPWAELEAQLPLERKLERGKLTAQKLEEGLIAVEIQLAWAVRPGAAAQRRYGLVRLRARPDLSIRAGYPFGDGEGNR